MRPGIARLFVAVVVLGCGGATCLYSGAGPIEGGGPAMRGTWNPVLAFIADLLTVPIPTAGIADVRDVALPVCTGVLLILAGATRAGSAGRSSATRWMAGCASVVIVMAIVSALVWRSFDLSWGWIVRFAAGSALAIVISQRFTPAMVRQTIVGLLAVAVLSLALTIWHRADRGYAHFTWPIGPITITGGLAAVWAALAGVWGVGLVIGRGGKVWAVAAFGATALCLYALQQTERRSPALGLIAAIVFVATFAAWRRYTNRGIKVAVVVMLAAIAVGAGVYVTRQSRSPDRETSGPIAVRKAYWEKSAKFIGSHPYFGIGPDRFVIEMTMAIAPLRAEMPHVYHGNLDTAAHNEWLQAAVELGLPAGLAYAALPIGVLLLALRFSQRSLASEPQGFVFALAAALIALAVCEAASINLRGPILPIWYWTILGLLAAAARPQSLARTEENRRRDRMRLIPQISGGVTCIAISIFEVFAAIEAVRSDASLGLFSPSRLFAERTLHSRYAAAEGASALANSTPSPELFAGAADDWRILYELLPVYRETATRYAETLIIIGRGDEAKRVLESVIVGGMIPYNVAANVLYGRLIADDVVGQLRCVQRILRSGGLDDIPPDLYNFGSLVVQDVLNKEVELARQAARSNDPAQLRGASIELVRCFASQYTSATPASAIADLELAAECYRRLEHENNPFRRSHEAETDVFFRLAGALNDLARHDAALDAILQAERYAVLGIKHEKLLHPNPSLGFVGGEAVPTEFPDRLRPLWQLSAILHMAAGDFRNIDFRILASLPPDRWTLNDLRREQVNLARITYESLESVPKNLRPAHYYGIAHMADIPTSQMDIDSSTKPNQ